ncbi:hypothetical protein BH11BAC7_BH11BAC7_06160 [soil metagenome]
MKAIYLCLAVILLAACNVEQESSTVAQPADRSKFCPDAEKQKLLKIIEGGWVNEKYIELFNRFRSPMTVAATDLFLQQVAFDISNVSGDTLLNALGRLNCNEGERFDVIFYKNKNGVTVMKLVENRNEPEKSFDLDYEIKGMDTVLIINGVKNNIVQTARFQRQFRRILSADEVPVTAMEYYVNKALFSGEWKMNGTEILFNENGHVKNFRSYHHYSVSTRDDEAASRPDEISFYSDTSGVTYAFTVKSNRIQLYELFHAEDGMSFSRGRMIGELKR